MTGTVGEPKRSINYAALGGTVLQGLGGTAGQAGSALQNLGGLFGHGASTNATGANTNQPSALGGLLHGLGGALGGGNTATNQPSTNRSSSGSLLDIFKKQ